MVQTLHRRSANRPPTTTTSSTSMRRTTAPRRPGARSSSTPPRDRRGDPRTPERTDGASIADLFGGDYTTEPRLREAVDHQRPTFETSASTTAPICANSSGTAAITSLVHWPFYTGDHERVRRIVEAIERWWTSRPDAGARILRSVEHAQFMAQEFTSLGLRADYSSVAKHDSGAPRRALVSYELVGSKRSSAWTCWARASTHRTSTPCRCFGPLRARCHSPTSSRSWLADPRRQVDVPGAGTPSWRAPRRHPPLRGSIPRAPRTLRTEACASRPSTSFPNSACMFHHARARRAGPRAGSAQGCPHRAPVAAV